MKYPNGEEIRLWDRVKMWEGCKGIVVFSIDSDEYSHAFPKELWSYLKRGVMFATDRAGLVHSSESDECMELIKRGGPPSAEEWEPIERSCSEQGGAGPPSVDELYKKDSPAQQPHRQRTRKTMPFLAFSQSSLNFAFG